PCAVIPCAVIPCAVIPCAVIPCAVIPCAVIPCAVIPCAVIPCAVIPCAVIPCAVIPCAVIPAYAPAEASTSVRQIQIGHQRFNVFLDISSFSQATSRCGFRRSHHERSTARAHGS